MECWTWGDVLVFFICTMASISWQLSPLGILIMFLKFPLFLFIELPVSVVQEFKLVNFERRIANRNFSTLFELSAMLFVRWVLRTFNSELIRSVFFSDVHARALFQYRRFKYGTDNIGDFDYESNPGSGYDAHGVKVAPGYWVRSKSRLRQKPDLAIYFVPGDLLGCASPYIYLEYLCMLLVELQVQGFRNPVVFCVDISYQHHRSQKFPFASIIHEVAEGWRHVQARWPRAKTLHMGSGVGGTLLLSLLLQIAKPYISVPIHPSLESSVINEAASDAQVEQGDASVVRTDENVPSLIKDPSESDLAIEADATNASVDEQTPTRLAINLERPDALLLISPISRITVVRKDHYGDFLTNKAIRKAFNHLMEDEADCLWTMPGQVRDSDWWSKALPNNGTVIMYGGLETLRREEEHLIQTLKDTADPRVVSDCRLNEVHAWPITRAFLARTATDQLDGISRVADHIAKMLVMDCLFTDGSLAE